MLVRDPFERPMLTSNLPLYSIALAKVGLHTSGHWILLMFLKIPGLVPKFSGLAQKNPGLVPKTLV